MSDSRSCFHSRKRDDGRLEDYGEGLCFCCVLREPSIAASLVGCWSRGGGGGPDWQGFAVESEGERFDEKSSRCCDMRRVLVRCLSICDVRGC